MFSRSPITPWQMTAYSSQPDQGCVAGGILQAFCRNFSGLMGICVGAVAKAVLPDVAVQNDVRPAVFPFLSGVKTIDSGARKTNKRGFAVCVNLSFFSRLLPRSVLPAVSRTMATATQIRRQTAQQCAPSVGPLPVPLLRMQPAAAKPKARLLARWSAACHAAFQACLPVTKSGLTAPHHCGVTTSTRSFGGIPRVAFLHFRAPRACHRKDCHV